MNLISTLRGSLLDGFYPAGLDLAKIDKLVSDDPADLPKREKWWHAAFEPLACTSVADFDTFMGHEIAQAVLRTRQAEKPLILILPVGPMGMYRWAVYFLKEWN